MTIKAILFTCALLLAASAGGCGSMEGDRSALDARKRFIVSWASKTPCSGTGECRFVGLGKKPCGGPWDFLVYSSSIDTANFLRTVSQYNADEENYNREWSVISDCSVAREPDSLRCYEGGCVGYWSSLRRIVGR